MRHAAAFIMPHYLPIPVVLYHPLESARQIKSTKKIKVLVKSVTLFFCTDYFLVIFVKFCNFLYRLFFCNSKTTDLTEFQDNRRIASVCHHCKKTRHGL